MPDTETKAFAVWLQHDSYGIQKEDADDMVDKFQDEYQGEYDSEKDFAYEIVEEYHDDLPEFAKTYFDYDAFARDLFIQDYWMEDGFVFRRA